MSTQAAQCVIKAIGLLREAESLSDARASRWLKLARFIAAAAARKLDPQANVPLEVYPWERSVISTGNNEAGDANG